MANGKQIDANRDVVTATVNVRESADVPKDEAREATWELDFSNVTREQILDEAARSVIITMQARERRNPGMYPTGTYRVDEVLTKQPATVDPKAAAKRYLARMTPEEREAFLAEIGAE